MAGLILLLLLTRPYSKRREWLEKLKSTNQCCDSVKTEINKQQIAFRYTELKLKRIDNRLNGVRKDND